MRPFAINTTEVEEHFHDPYAGGSRRKKSNIRFGETGRGGPRRRASLAPCKRLLGALLLVISCDII